MIFSAPRSFLFALFILFVPAAGMAQSPAPQTAAAPDQDLLKPEALDALVAPIALYPDTLLSLVLMASTYPLGGRAGGSLGERKQEPQRR